MPEIQVIFYQETSGNVPVLAWLDALLPKVKAKCIVKIERLQKLGYELRRPESDYLRDDIYELRIAYRGIQYRLLYFFWGRNATVISHGIVKEQRVPSTEINLAIQRKRNFEQNPGRHTYSQENDS